MKTNNEAEVAKHTPGPWVLHKTSARIEIHPQGRKFAYAFSLTDEANARLIAAAPELLAACAQALEWEAEVPAPYRDFPFIRAIKAALTKAEGKA